MYIYIDNPLNHMDSRRKREVREEFPQLPISWQIEVLETLESQAIEALNSEKPKYACVSDLTWQWATKQDLFRFIYWDVGEFSWGFLGYVCWQESKNHTSLNGRNTSNIKWLEWLRLDLSIFSTYPLGGAYLAVSGGRSQACCCTRCPPMSREFQPRWIAALELEA